MEISWAWEGRGQGGRDRLWGQMNRQRIKQSCKERQICRHARWNGHGGALREQTIWGRREMRSIHTLGNMHVDLGKWSGHQSLFRLIPASGKQILGTKVHNMSWQKRIIAHGVLTFSLAANSHFFYFSNFISTPQISIWNYLCNAEFDPSIHFNNYLWFILILKSRFKDKNFHGPLHFMYKMDQVGAA